MTGVVCSVLSRLIIDDVMILSSGLRCIDSSNISLLILFIDSVIKAIKLVVSSLYNMPFTWYVLNTGSASNFKVKSLSV